MSQKKTREMLPLPLFYLIGLKKNTKQENKLIKAILPDGKARLQLSMMEASSES